MSDLTKILNNPEEHYPGNFDTPQRANALLTGLCQDAANEIERLNAEVLEQCRINGMSAEREDALRAELTQLKASIALDWMAKNAREIGLDYEPPKQDVPETNFGNMAHPDYAWPTIEQRAVIQQMVDALDHADDLLCDTLVMNGAAAGRWLLEQPAGQEPVQDSTCNETLRVQGKAYPRTCKKCGLGPCVGKPKSVTTPPAPQPVPVKTYHDGKPWPVAPKPWVGLTETEVEAYDSWADFQVGCGRQTLFDMVRDIEAKLRSKNHG